MNYFIKCIFVVWTLALLPAAYAQDLKSLEDEVQSQMKVTRDLSNLVQSAIEQDQHEAGMSHYDYWIKKRMLVSRVSAALAKYEEFLATHMDELKELYARYIFIGNSEQYTKIQKVNLQEDVMKEVTQLVNLKIQPAKTAAYVELLSSISPFLPLVLNSKFVRAGEPTREIKFPNFDLYDLMLLDVTPGCLSKGCMRLYATDVASLINDFLVQIPSIVIVKLGTRDDSKRLVRDEKTVDVTERIRHYISRFLGVVSASKADFTLDDFNKGLNYPLTEQEYISDKDKLEMIVKKNAIAIDKNLNLQTMISVIADGIRFNSYQCGKVKLDSVNILKSAREICSYSRVEGGKFCLKNQEDLRSFSVAFLEHYRNECGSEEKTIKLLTKVMSVFTNNKW